MESSRSDTGTSARLWHPLLKSSVALLLVVACLCLLVLMGGGAVALSVTLQLLP